MPLSEPEEREMLHRRSLELRGYRRADGLFEVEAEITDTKTYAFSMQERGEITPGVPLHNMKLRMTYGEDLVIRKCEVAIDHSPYPSVCPGAAPNFSRLAGVRIAGGFLKQAMQRVGGTDGCTHVREMLQQVGTVALQTLMALRVKQREAREAATGVRAPPAQLDTCYGWSSKNAVIKRGWPDLYTGP